MLRASETGATKAIVSQQFGRQYCRQVPRGRQKLKFERLASVRSASVRRKLLARNGKRPRYDVCRRSVRRNLIVLGNSVLKWSVNGNVRLLKLRVVRNGPLSHRSTTISSATVAFVDSVLLNPAQAKARAGNSFIKIDPAGTCVPARCCSLSSQDVPELLERGDDFQSIARVVLAHERAVAERELLDHVLVSRTVTSESAVHAAHNDFDVARVGNLASVVAPRQLLLHSQRHSSKPMTQMVSSFQMLKSFAKLADQSVECTVVSNIFLHDARPSVGEPTTYHHE